MVYPAKLSTAISPEPFCLSRSGPLLSLRRTRQPAIKQARCKREPFRFRRLVRLAEKQHRKGDHVAAFGYFARAANQGHAASQASVAFAYLHGRGVPASADAAISWFKRAATSGDVGAMEALARLTLEESCRVRHPEKQLGLYPSEPRPDLLTSRTWAAKAVDAGSAEARVILAGLLLLGRPDPEEIASAHEQLRQAVADGSSTGRLSLAVAMLAGKPTMEVRQEALDLIATAARAKLPLALYLQGVALEFCPENGPDIAQAVRLYAAAAAAGIRSAQTRFGYALMLGNGVAQNIVAGETWLRRAAAAGDGAAAALVAEIYVRDGDLPPNYAEARLWFDHAAKLGHADSAASIGLMYLTGMGCGHDPQAASHWFTRFRELGNASSAEDPACLVFPACHQPGRRLHQPAWFKTAAAAGEVMACFRLGTCYMIGIGCNPAPDRAASWMQAAAVSLPIAQYLFGQMRAVGQGVAQDVEDARCWLHRAAEKGLAGAQAALAEMYFNGRGGDRDEAAAFELFKQAAHQNHPGAAYALGIINLRTGKAADIEEGKLLLRQAAAQGHREAHAVLTGL